MKYELVFKGSSRCHNLLMGLLWIVNRDILANVHTTCQSNHVLLLNSFYFSQFVDNVRGFMCWRYDLNGYCVYTREFKAQNAFKYGWLFLLATSGLLVRTCWIKWIHSIICTLRGHCFLSLDTWMSVDYVSGFCNQAGWQLTLAASIWALETSDHYVTGIYKHYCCRFS